MQRADKRHMSKNTLKVIAIIAMTLGHIAYGFLAEGNLSLALDAVSQITYPIMLFFLCEGFFRTTNILKYGLRLFVFGLLAQYPYLQYFHTYKLNILFSLLLGLIFLYIFTNIENKAAKVLLVLLFAFPFYFMESVWYTPIFILIYLWCKKKGYSVLWAFIVGAIWYFGYNFAAFVYYGVYPVYHVTSLVFCTVAKALSGILITYFYRSDPGALHHDSLRYKINKYFFYAYYPVHLWILMVIAGK